MKLFFTLFFACLFISLTAGNLRVYQHVKDFYAPITGLAIEVGIATNTPPAALLAIAGLESGYGQGYVARISGNVMSLGAGKSDVVLPPLHLPRVGSQGQILFIPAEIAQYTPADLEWTSNPPSYKKDYRPQFLAGSSDSLDYFINNKTAYYQAVHRNFSDFCTRWLNVRSKNEVFSLARLWLDTQVKTQGTEILFAENTTMQLIDMIGGKPNSFNHRATWVDKVSRLFKNARLNELTRQLYYRKKSFQEAWND